MAQFPLALSIEPRLLPLAIANGFRMDSRVRIYYLFLVVRSDAHRGKYGVQYRDFVFRRIFARTQEHGVEDVLLNVRELCRLDASYAPGCIAFVNGLTRYSVGCLSAVPLPQRF
jgi:hypothetical protein